MDSKSIFDVMESNKDKLNTIYEELEGIQGFRGKSKFKEDHQIAGLIFILSYIKDIFPDLQNNISLNAKQIDEIRKLVGSQEFQVLMEINNKMVQTNTMQKTLNTEIHASSDKINSVAKDINKSVKINQDTKNLILAQYEKISSEMNSKLDSKIDIVFEKLSKNVDNSLQSIQKSIIKSLEDQSKSHESKSDKRIALMENQITDLLNKSLDDIKKGHVTELTNFKDDYSKSLEAGNSILSKQNEVILKNAGSLQKSSKLIDGIFNTIDELSKMSNQGKETISEIRDLFATRNKELHEYNMEFDNNIGKFKDELLYFKDRNNEFFKYIGIFNKSKVNLNELINKMNNEIKNLKEDHTGFEKIANKLDNFQISIKKASQFVKEIESINMNVDKLIKISDTFDILEPKISILDKESKILTESITKNIHNIEKLMASGSEIISISKNLESTSTRMQGLVTKIDQQVEFISLAKKVVDLKE